MAKSKAPNNSSVIVAVPKYKNLTLEYEDREQVVLKSYIKGPGCPVPVQMAVELAWADWEDSALTREQRTREDGTTYYAMLDEDGNELGNSRYIYFVNMRERNLRRDMLIAITPGLDMEDANFLASDGGHWNQILVERGWWDADNVVDEDTESDPEAQGEEVTPTGEPSSPS